MFIFPATESEMEKVAKDLKNKLPAGIDDIPDYFIKRCMQVLKKPLTYRMRLCSRNFPDRLKVAKVIPYENDIHNYRPVDLLSVFFFKLLEKLMYNMLMTFIEGNEVLRHNMGLGRKHKLKQHYGFSSKVHRRPLRKR
jgi:hypothetical protein